MSEKRERKGSKERSELKGAVTGRFVTKGATEGDSAHKNTTIGRFVSKRDGVFGGHQIVNGAIEPKVSKSIPKPPPRSTKTSDKDEK